MNADNMVEEGKNVAESTMSDMQARFQKGKEAVKKYTDKAREYTSKYAQEAREKTEEQIHKQPFTAVLVALGLGLGVGLMAGMLMRGGRDYDYE